MVLTRPTAIQGTPIAGPTWFSGWRLGVVLSLVVAVMSLAAAAIASVSTGGGWSRVLVEGSLGTWPGVRAESSWHVPVAVALTTFTTLAVPMILFWFLNRTTWKVGHVMIARSRTDLVIAQLALMKLELVSRLTEAFIEYPVPPNEVKRIVDSSVDVAYDRLRRHADNLDTYWENDDEPQST